MHWQRINHTLVKCQQLSSVLYNQLLHQVSNGNIYEARLIGSSKCYLHTSVNTSSPEDSRKITADYHSTTYVSK